MRCGEKCTVAITAVEFAAPNYRSGKRRNAKWRSRLPVLQNEENSDGENRVNFTD